MKYILKKLFLIFAPCQRQVIHDLAWQSQEGSTLFSFSPNQIFLFHPHLGERGPLDHILFNG